MTIGGAGPLESEASTTMGQAHSATAQAKTEKLRRRSSTTILREDSIQQTFENNPCPSPASENTPALSGSNSSWSMHYDCANQLPYSTAHTLAGSSNVDTMNTQTSLARLPKDNPSHDLAWFLKNTAPPAPHRKPSRADHPHRAVSGKNALRLLRNGSGQQKKHRVSLIQTAHDR